MENIAAALEEKRATLEAELERMSAPPEETSGISFGKRVGDGTSVAVERVVQVEAHDQLRALLADVRRALAKIADDSYGVCDGCGTAISPERMQYLPWAILCIECASRRQKA